MARKSIHDPFYRATIAILLERREMLGWSQAELGAKLGRRQQYVSRYEKFERRLDLIEYCDIAHALGLDGAAEVGRLWRTAQT
jgi:transcriptional regulator with XRE-family HTH domain